MVAAWLCLKRRPLSTLRRQHTGTNRQVWFVGLSLLRGMAGRSLRWSRLSILQPAAADRFWGICSCWCWGRQRRIKKALAVRQLPAQDKWQEKTWAAQKGCAGLTLFLGTGLVHQCHTHRKAVRNRICPRYAICASRRIHKEHKGNIQPAFTQ